ncbi:hypothetical protein ARMSODRAFT_688705 [Armillaria solidipes]|uniref:Uncharacterized protein n=1 Tax=Armillaria solidipes TaxID=1076256 RepID=A0A2H3B813_9AGAR|nr:hypothetical protein ARMSODRAFT_688705 [Armillaria solidipes]
MYQSFNTTAGRRVREGGLSFWRMDDSFLGIHLFYKVALSSMTHQHLPRPRFASTCCGEIYQRGDAVLIIWTTLSCENTSSPPSGPTLPEAQPGIHTPTERTAYHGPVIEYLPRQEKSAKLLSSCLLVGLGAFLSPHRHPLASPSISIMA